MSKCMWEILVPTIRRRDGKPIKTRYHRVWDTKVRAISGGLTVLSPAKGQWIARDGELFVERMIPVRIMCNEEEINKIVDMTLEYYDQLAVLEYKISDNVIMRHADEVDIQKKD